MADIRIHNGGIDVIVIVPVKLGLLEIDVLTRISAFGPEDTFRVHVYYEDYENMKYMGVEVTDYHKLINSHKDMGIDLIKAVDAEAERLFSKEDAIRYVKNYTKTLFTGTYE